MVKCATWLQSYNADFIEKLKDLERVSLDQQIGKIYMLFFLHRKPMVKHMSILNAAYF